MTTFEQITYGLLIFGTQKNPDICAKHDVIYVLYDRPLDKDYNSIETLTEKQIEELKKADWTEEYEGWGHFV